MESGVLPPSTVELNLLLEWPDQRSGPQWAMILGISVLLHVVFFTLGVRIPSLIGGRHEPERQVTLRHIRLYLPPDLMTQRAPNRQRVSKQIDLADLAPSQPERPSSGSRHASVRRFEMPKQAAPKDIARNSPPQILPQAPSVDTNQSTAAPQGTPGGLPVAQPPAPSNPPGPFQDIDGAAPPNPNPKLAPPKAGLDAAIKGMAQDTGSRQLVISDDVPDRVLPGSPGTIEQAPAQHAAVELQSDPNGVDFKAYLRTILSIVRANWRRVIPESARMGAVRGRTVIEFIIDRNGSIPKLVTADPSGSEPLDRAAVAGLSMSNPLPPLPPGFKGLQVRLAFTFAYNMPAR